MQSMETFETSGMVLMRKRLRPAWSEEELAKIYAQPHQHRKHHDHKLRVQATIALARWFADGAMSVADLSAGDATIIESLDIPDKHIGDFAFGYEYTGAIERTIDEIPNVDLYICSETIEHLDDPDRVLKQIRSKARMLILTTPIAESDDSNPEHYWGWDIDDMEAILIAAKWNPRVLQTLRFRGNYHYDFQLWACD